MSAFAIHQGLLGFLRLLTTAVAAGWVSSPMSWSPDARWLAYSVAPDPGKPSRAPGWLFEAGAQDRSGREGPDSSGYRIWASPRDGGASVLIEGSAWPLSAATWSPQGRALVYARFVPESPELRSPAPRGRLEWVVQDGLDRKRVVCALPDFELDEEARAGLPDAGPSWSPDGQYLALPRPGRLGSLLIVKVDSRKLLRTFDRARLPAWSPDGTRLAFLGVEEGSEYSLRVVERRGSSFAGLRAVLPTGRVAAPVSWAGDGRSILAVVERPGLRFPDLDLSRVAPETHESMRIFGLAQEVRRRLSPVRGLAIDFDRDEDLCFFSVDFEGQDADVCWSIPREGMPYKRFHPLDPRMRIGGLAIAPDGRAVAMRFGTPGGLSLPALVDPATERATPIVPDEAGRRAWLDLLAGTARSLLVTALPPAMVDGERAERPTLLPLPDEIPTGHPLQPRPRLLKLARLGSALCAARPPRPAGVDGPAPDDPPESERDREDRLFFDYLRGDYAAASADLDALESLAETRGRRLALLALRAQILWARGDRDRARDVADYLLEAAGRPAYRVEETPTGRALAPEPNPTRTWARYLAGRIGEPAAPPASAAGPAPPDRDDTMILNPFAPPGAVFPREHVPPAPVPFAPAGRG